MHACTHYTSATNTHTFTWTRKYTGVVGGDVLASHGVQSVDAEGDGQSALQCFKESGPLLIGNDVLQAVVLLKQVAVEFRRQIPLAAASCSTGATSCYSVFRVRRVAIATSTDLLVLSAVELSSLKTCSTVGWVNETNSELWS